jgi:hypothetical protein
MINSDLAAMNLCWCGWGFCQRAGGFLEKQIKVQKEQRSMPGYTVESQYGVFRRRELI